MSCEKCEDGYIYRTENINGIEYEFAEECECIKAERTARKQAKHIADSGLSEIFERYSFESYRTDSDACKCIKTLALEFLQDTEAWWYISSIPGTGKTHITTAICSSLIRQGKEVHYMQWRQESTELKAAISDGSLYSEQLKKIQNVECLYIDDFLKGTVTPADLNLAFTIINYRYNRNLKTLFSTERKFEKLIEFDKAIAGRIREKAGKYVLNITSLGDRRLDG